MRLFPKLPISIARDVAVASAASPIADLLDASAEHHAAAVYAPVGGTRVHAREVGHLGAQLRAVAEANRYPMDATDADRVAFDAQAARLLTAEMDISPNEAADPRLWAFIACVVAPDIVRWRFPGGEAGTSEERFIGKARGLRNTFGRLWWRSQLIRTPERGVDPLGRLGEDELVQITERTNIAGSWRLASQMADSFLEAVDRYPQASRSQLMRETMKRIRRLAAFVEFEALDDDLMVGLVDDVFEESARTIVAGLATATR